MLSAAASTPLIHSASQVRLAVRQHNIATDSARRQLDTEVGQKIEAGVQFVEPQWANMHLLIWRVRVIG